MTPTTHAADEIRELLLQASVSGDAGQQALDRLYHHYDPLIRASLPKRLSPEDAEDLVMDVWSAVVAELRQGRRLRRDQDVVELIGETIRSAITRQAEPELAPRPRRTFWQWLKAQALLLLPAKDEDDW